MLAEFYTDKKYFLDDSILREKFRKINQKWYGNSNYVKNVPGWTLKNYHNNKKNAKKSTSYLWYI